MTLFRRQQEQVVLQLHQVGNRMSGGKLAKVLVVDDDPRLLRTMGVYLRRRSYEVVTCSSAAEATEEFQAAPGTYAVLVVDMTLQDMPAEQLVDKVLQVDRKVGVIVTSGYPVKLPRSASSSGRHILALQKPFTPQTFIQAIEQMLSSRR
jgi:DNA-binding NtrC family response regulator